MATKIGAGNVLASYAQSSGWKLLNQLVNSNSRFGIFDRNGNPFYEAGLQKSEMKFLGKTLSFAGNKNGADAGVISFNYNKNYSVTTAPVEGGNMMSINLVEQPRTGQVTYVSTGTEEQRRLFEDALEKVEKDLRLFILHTAERMIENIKIIGHSINRSATQGAQLVHYQINFQEIITAPTHQLLSHASDTNKDSQSRGFIEGQAASGNQKQAANKK